MEVKEKEKEKGQERESLGGSATYVENGDTQQDIALRTRKGKAKEV